MWRVDGADAQQSLLPCGECVTNCIGKVVQFDIAGWHQPELTNGLCAQRRQGQVRCVFPSQATGMLSALRLRNTVHLGLLEGIERSLARTGQRLQVPAPGSARGVYTANHL